MDAEPDRDWAQDSGLEPDHEPRLDEFLLARIAEDKRIAVDAAAAAGAEDWAPGEPPASAAGARQAAEQVARLDPARVLAECAAKRRIVLACRDARPDLSFLGRRARTRRAHPGTARPPVWRSPRLPPGVAPVSGSRR